MQHIEVKDCGVICTFPSGFLMILQYNCIINICLLIGITSHAVGNENVEVWDNDDDLLPLLYTTGYYVTLKLIHIHL